MVSIVLKLLFRLIVGVIGKKLSLAVAAVIVGLRGPHMAGVGRTVRRARAALPARTRTRRVENGS